MFYVPPKLKQVPEDTSGIEYYEKMHPPPAGFKTTTLSCAYCNDGDILNLRVSQSVVKVSDWLDRHKDCKELAERNRTVFAKQLFSK